jgi:uncharacterized protein (DUF885 family)
MLRLSLTALLLACANPPLPPPARLDVPPLPVSRSEPPAVSIHLKSLADRYWSTLLETAPLGVLGGGPLAATELGDHRFDGRLDDLSPEARVRTLQQLAELRTAIGEITAGELDGEDVLTVELLRGRLDAAIASAQCEEERWVVDQLDGPHVALAQTQLYYPLGTAQGADELAARYSQAGRFFDQIVANLSRGLAAGKTSPRTNVQRVIDQLGKLLERTADLLPSENRFAGLPAPQRGPAREAIRKAIEVQVAPGLRRYRDFLRDQLRPRARTEVGIRAMPGGDACYSFLVWYHTGGRLTPQQLHQLGAQELKKIESEQLAIARSQGAPDINAFRKSLDQRKDQFKQTADELLEWNKATLSRAMSALPQAFHRLPPRPIETRAIESYRAASNTVAFYQPAPDDGSQPAVYYVNTYKPETRALYNEEALCFHEAVPGHHLQLSIAQELQGLPDFRRLNYETAYVEGWGLYAERMSDETLHLYTGPPARFGMLGYQAWRASRLVVDTGMHALHWDRERAVQFLKEHTTLPDDEAANEIDRYIIHPAQALAYMVGELEIYRLRRDAEAKLGAKFDLKDFHDVVLNHGAVPLRTLEQIVGEWVSGKTGAPRSRADPTSRDTAPPPAPR